MDEYVEESCDNCGSELTQLAGDWICLNCNDLEEFTHDGKDYDFAV